MTSSINPGPAISVEQKLEAVSALFNRAGFDPSAKISEVVEKFLKNQSAQQEVASLRERVAALESKPDQKNTGSQTVNSANLEDGSLTESLSKQHISKNPLRRVFLGNQVGMGALGPVRTLVEKAQIVDARQNEGREGVEVEEKRAYERLELMEMGLRPRQGKTPNQSNTALKTIAVVSGMAAVLGLGYSLFANRNAIQDAYSQGGVKAVGSSTAQAFQGAAVVVKKAAQEMSKNGASFLGDSAKKGVAFASSFGKNPQVDPAVAMQDLSFVSPKK